MSISHTILIDGNNALFRFGNVMPNLKTQESEYTGAIHGLFMLLLRLKKKYPRARFVIVWDGAERRSGWRFKLFGGYKKRDEAENSQTGLRILLQKARIVQLAQILHIPQITIPELEADDVLGVLSFKCLESGWKPIIYSSDKDFLQLMPYGIEVIRDVDKKERLKVETPESVYALFACRPSEVRLVRAFVGDKSDRIPGVRKGVGAKTAAAYVRTMRTSDFHKNTLEDSMFPDASFADVKTELQRNYLLMRILRFPFDPVLPKATQRSFNCALNNVVKQLSKARVVGSSRQLLKLLGELELSMLISRRKELLTLQD